MSQTIVLVEFSGNTDDDSYPLIDQRNSFAVVKYHTEQMEELVRMNADSEDTSEPDAIGQNDDEIECIRLVCQESHATLTSPTWTNIDQINDHLKNLVSTFETDSATEPCRCENCKELKEVKVCVQLNLLHLLKCILDILEWKGNIQELLNSLESLQTFKSRIATIIAAFHGDEPEREERMKAGFEVAYKAIDTHIKVYQQLKSGTVKFDEFVKVPNEFCGVCQAKKLTRRTDFAILSGCRHRFCVPCAAIWFEMNSTCPMCRAHIPFIISRKKVLSWNIQGSRNVGQEGQGPNTRQPGAAMGRGMGQGPNTRQPGAAMGRGMGQGPDTRQPGASMGRGGRGMGRGRRKTGKKK